MKPPKFDYVRPTTVDDALDVLEKNGEVAKIIAGGQSLVPMLNLRLAHPDLLIDINRLDLGRMHRSDGGLTVGALTRQRELLEDQLIAKHLPLLAEATRFVGHAAIRNRGTVGGSLCHADPTAELAAVAVSLDAVFHLLSSRGKRTAAARDFFVSVFTTLIEPDELLEAVTFPLQPDDDRYAFMEVAERGGDFAIVAVAVRFEVRESRIVHPNIVVSGADSRPIRCKAAEATLEGSIPGPDLFAEAARDGTKDLDPPGDIRASAKFRRRLITVLIERALTRASNREPGNGN
jgi:CO/xanthine dehydrogenase FAD-binding subunit